MPKYNHKITLKELKNSESAFIKTALSHEQKNYSEGLQMAEADIGRIVLVNKKNFSKQLTANKNESNESKELFNSILKEELELDDEGLKLINTSYSQSLYSLLVDPFVSDPAIGVVTGRLFKAEDRVENLYLKNNEIYFKSTAERYSTGKYEGQVTYIHSPTELLYKLNKETGLFDLQSIKTHSDFVRDVFLGKNISEKRLAAIVIPDRYPAIGTINTILENYKTNDTMINDVFTIAKETVALCGKGKITLQELEEALEKLKPAIAEFEKDKAPSRLLSKFFTPSTRNAVTNASKALDQAIKKVKEIPGYQPREEEKAEAKTNGPQR